MKKNFTLSEVLITLVVIGIIAAITVMILITDIQEKATVQRVKQAYSMLSQAYGIILKDEGSPDEWGMQGMYDDISHKILAKKFIPYMKVQTDCTDMTSTHQSGKYCSSRYSDIASYSSFTTINGLVFTFRSWNKNCTSRYGYVKNVCGQIIVDINGNKNPNVLGRDLFSFYFTKDKIYPIGTNGDSISLYNYCTNIRAFGQPYGNYANGMGCTAWVIYNENMDYLRCSDLSWEGKKECK